MSFQPPAAPPAPSPPEGAVVPPAPAGAPPAAVPPGYGPPPGGFYPHPPMTPARSVLLLLFVAFLLAAAGLLIRYITGFLDASPGVFKARMAGTMIFAYGSLTLGLSLFWAAYRVFEGAAVRVGALLVGFLLFLLSFLLLGM